MDFQGLEFGSGPSSLQEYLRSHAMCSSRRTRKSDMRSLTNVEGICFSRTRQW